MKFSLFTFILFISLLATSQQDLTTDPRTLEDGWYKIMLEGGSIYDGEIISGKLDGKGIMKWIDGSEYSGFWKNNARNGRGTMKWKDGRVYMGRFKNDQMNGRGTLIYPDGKKVHGKFKNGALIKK